MERTVLEQRSAAKLGLGAGVALTAFIFLMTLFFTTYSAKGGQESVSGLILTAWVSCLSFLILRSGKPGHWRAVLFGSFAFMFFPSFIGILLEGRGSMSLSEKDVFLNNTPFCHIVIPSVILPYLAKGVVVFPAKLTNHFASIYSMLTIWIFATLILGRGWCSWVCFYGGWDDSLSRLSGKVRLKLDPRNDKYRYFGFAMLIFIALASLASLGPVYCNWLCPFKMVTEYGEVTDFLSFFAFVLFTLTFFGFAVVLPLLTRKRVQCTVLCPFGAFQSLVGKLSLYRVRIDPEKCSSCLTCVRVCPTSSLRPQDIEAKNGKAGLTCTLCGECVQACPQKAVHYDFAWAKVCGVKEGILRKLGGKWRERGGWGGRAASSLAFALDDILSPRALFTVCAIVFGATICGSFGAQTVNRVLNIFTHGSFLLK
jgi:ferredoxin-type protein NapH